MWRRKAEIIRNVTQCLVFGERNHIPDFRSAELCFIAHYLVPSPTEFLNCYVCHVWSPLKMKPGICDLPNIPQKLWE